MLNIWDFEIIMFILSFVGIATAVFFAGRFIKKRISRHLKARQKVKLDKKVRAKTQKKQKNKSKEVEVRNAFHNIENYQSLYAKNYINWQKETDKQEQIIEEADFTQKDKIYDNSHKKLFRKLKKLDKSARIAAENSNIQPDFVANMLNSEGEIIEDERTYIQVLDDAKTNEFSQVVSQTTNTGENIFPYVMKIDFNNESKLSPLIVSSPNSHTYARGAVLILDKAISITEDDKSAFPIIISQQHKSFPKPKRYLVNNINELNEIKNNIESKEQESEQSF